MNNCACNCMCNYTCLVRDASSRNIPPPPTPEIRVGEYFTSGLFCLQRKHLAYEYFLTSCFSQGGVVSASPNPQAGGPPLVGCPRLLIQLYMCTFLYIMCNKKYTDNRRKKYSKNTIYNPDQGVTIFSICLENKSVM